MRSSNGHVVWLWCWLGVLVAGCSSAVVATSNPATLTLLTLPAPTLELLRSTSAVILTLSPAAPLGVPEPNCYETPVGSLWCLGLIRNDMLHPIEQIAIKVILLREDGSIIEERLTPTARAVLMPGEYAPYGVLFERGAASSIGATAVLTRAVEITDPARIPNIVVRGVETRIESSIYHVTGEVVNLGTRPVLDVQLVATLFDEQDQVTGFRQLHMGLTLAPGEATPFAMYAIPQGLGTMRLEVSADGRTG
jgi:hypothetical protein